MSNCGKFQICFKLKYLVVISLYMIYKFLVQGGEEGLGQQNYFVLNIDCYFIQFFYKVFIF